jgi:hypothetical protein
VALLSGEDYTGLIPWEGAMHLVTYVDGLLTHAEQWHSPVNAALSAPLIGIVELGCGSGLASLAAVTSILQRRPRPPEDIVVVLTDKSPECVRLAAANAETLKGASCGRGCRITAMTIRHEWGSSVPREARSDRLFEQADRLILSADVLYEAESVAPLVLAVERWAENTARCVWMLSVMPRCLRVQSNVDILRALIVEIQRRPWVVVQAALIPQTRVQSPTVTLLDAEEGHCHALYDDISVETLLNTAHDTSTSAWLESIAMRGCLITVQCRCAKPQDK